MFTVIFISDFVVRVSEILIANAVDYCNTYFNRLFVSFFYIYLYLFICSNTMLTVLTMPIH